MKKILIVLFFFVSVFTACKKNENPPANDGFSDGTITGIDFRKCMCCGGYFIKIDTIQYRFYENPDTNIIKLDGAVFPIYVKLKWKLKNNPCLSDLIDVLLLKKR